jgi:hypothetical protein
MTNILELNPADIDISGTVVALYRDNEEEYVWWDVFEFQNNRFVDIIDSSHNNKEGLDNIRKLCEDFDIRGLMLGKRSVFWMYLCDGDYKQSIEQFREMYPEEFL